MQKTSQTFQAHQLKQYKANDVMLQQPYAKEEYQQNGIVYLKSFLTGNDLVSVINEISYAQTKAERDINNYWAGNKVCFYSKSAQPFKDERIDYVNQPYFQLSGNKIHVFYENINNITKVNRIGHGLHLFPEYNTLQQMTYHNPFLNAVLKLAGLMRPVCHLSVYIPKYGHGIGSDVKPHQESTFTFTEPQSTVVLWIALEDASIDNACMWGILGSNHWPLKYLSHVNPITKRRQFLCLNEDLTLPDFFSQRAYFTPLPVKAGDALFFHGNFVHCSPINSSARSRKSLSLQFVETRNVHYAQSNWLQPLNKHYIYDNV